MCLDFYYFEFSFSLNAFFLVYIIYFVYFVFTFMFRLYFSVVFCLAIVICCFRVLFVLLLYFSLLFSSVVFVFCLFAFLYFRFMRHLPESGEE